MSPANLVDHIQMSKKKVLFLCTHNSSRSQIAEGIMNSLMYEKYVAHSAGTEPGGVNKFAIKVMNEIGVDISQHRSKSTDEFLDENFDFVVTVCDSANENCPVFLRGGNLIHKGFSDPTRCRGADEYKLKIFREVRDEIKKWIEEVFN